MAEIFSTINKDPSVFRLALYLFLCIPDTSTISYFLEHHISYPFS